MRVFRIICLLLIFLSLLCCKKKVANPDDGLPHYNARYTDFEPAWSPDGKTIAYVHGGIGDEYGDTTGIYLINVDGTDKRMFYKGIKAYSPDFSPDGKWVVLSDYAQIFKIKINGDSLTQLTFEGGNFFPDWSPDGREIAYERTAIGPLGIWVMGADGVNKKYLALGEFPDFSPDSKRILFEIASYTPGNNYVDHYFCILSLEDTNQIRLPLVRGDNRYPVFSPDGKKIAFSSMYYSAPVIYLMDSEGNNLKMLTPEGGDNPAWSPDGKYIVYADVRPEYGRLFIMNSDGTGKKQLTFGK